MPDDADKPVSDKSTLNSVIAAYLEQSRSGNTPDRQQFLNNHPELAEELNSFFANHDQLRAATPEDVIEGQPPSQEDATEPPNGAADNDATLPPNNPAVTGDEDRRRVRYFGDYELLEEIARGGMGVVYKARQVNLNRIVALKMILAGQLASEEEVRRFHAEAEAAANLDHPGIVPIFEVGEYQGQHYFSMGFVEGESLAEKIKDGPLPPQKAAEYTKKVAAAINFAHGRGVIHRDLKPANVLLAPNDQPKVTDFGLAKKVEGNSDLTATGQILGTPSYMPPEQASGSLETTELSDVYSLGAVFYALLTGRPPFQSASPMDTLLQVLDQEPIAPRLLNSKIPQDLETICLKCLQKDRTRRYPSADAVADELRRYLRGEPIIARPITTPQRVQRWCRRNPVIAGLSSLVAISILFGLTATLWQWRRAEKNYANLLVSQSEQFREHQLVRRHLYNSDMNAVQRARELQDANRMREVLERHIPRGDEPDLRSFEWYYWWQRCHEESKVFTHPDRVGAVAWSPNGSQMVTLCRDKRLRLWRIDDGTVERVFDGTYDVTEPSRNLLFSSDGNSLIVLTQDGTVNVLGVDDGNLLRFLNVGERVGVMALSPDETKLATAAFNKVTLWDFLTGVKIDEIEPKHTLLVCGMTFSPDGEHVAFGGDCDDGRPPSYRLELWNLDEGTSRILHRTPNAHINDTAFTPDGKTLASCDGDGNLTIWHGDDFSFHDVRSCSTTHLRSLSVSNDGSRLATVGAGGKVTLWSDYERQWADPRLTLDLIGHASLVNDVAFSPDGMILATAGDDKTVRLWDLEGPAIDREWQSFRRLQTIPLGPGRGSFVAMVGSSSRVMTWTDREEAIEPFALPEEVHILAISANGLALCSRRHKEDTAERFSYWLMDYRGNKPDIPLPDLESAWCAEFSSDGRALAIGAGTGFSLWNVDSAKPTEHYQQTEDGINNLAISPDGHWLAASSGNSISVWDLRTHHLHLTLHGHTHDVRDLAFNSDGSLLASGGDDQAVIIWMVERGEPMMTLTGHTRPVTSVAFSHDHRTLASGGETVRLWDSATGDLLTTFDAVNNGTFNLIWSSDGRTLAANLGFQTTRLWNAALDSGPR